MSRSRSWCSTARGSSPGGPVVSRLLILGGTADARALAARVRARWPAMRVITSLAGRTAAPRLP
ncbi:MAG: precorrin-6A/cobalt-precorrin-6A reductase, partial [Rhodospirillales bacterium]